MPAASARNHGESDPPGWGKGFPETIGLGMSPPPGAGKVGAASDRKTSGTLSHVATVDIEPISVDLGMALSYRVLDWIRDSWSRKYSRRSGHIAHGDFDRNSHLEQHFTEALLVETTFPALDASSKEPLYMTAKILPETIEVKAGSGRLDGQISSLQKLWSANSFSVNIDGVDCAGVNKVDSFTIKQKHKKFHYGSARLPTVEPTGIEFPNLVLYVSLARAKGFFDWHDQYVVRGRRDTAMEKTGAITYRGPNGDALLTLNLKGVGITAVSIEKSEANSDKIKLAKIELFVESMELEDTDGLE
jgi:hypothetical protein